MLIFLETDDWFVVTGCCNIQVTNHWLLVCWIKTLCAVPTMKTNCMKTKQRQYNQTGHSKMHTRYAENKQRIKKTEPSVVIFYSIQPWYGSGLFVTTSVAKNWPFSTCIMQTTDRAVSASLCWEHHHYITLHALITCRRSVSSLSSSCSRLLCSSIIAHCSLSSSALFDSSASRSSSASRARSSSSSRLALSSASSLHQPHTQYHNYGSWQPSISMKHMIWYGIVGFNVPLDTV